jgi:hypothetical protein
LARRIALVLAAAGLATAVCGTALGGPLDPLRQVFKEPADTIKDLVRSRGRIATPSPETTGSVASGSSQASPGATPAAPDAAPVAEPAAADQVPLPRLRPDDAGDADAGEGVEAAFAVAFPDEPAKDDTIAALMAAAAFDDHPADDAAAIPDQTSVPAAPPLAYADPAGDIPVPPLRPRHAPVMASASAGLDEERGAALAGALRPGSACSRSLVSLGVVAVSVEPIRSGSCGIAAPVAVAALDGGDVRLTSKAVVNCELAAALATWMADTVDPIARKRLGGEVTEIRVAAAYDCRSRNGVSGAKLSEHAKGNAIDISAFKVNGDWIEVGGGNGLAQAAFLREVRRSACGPFTTVLGPGSDAYHSDHFHLDLAKRGQSGRGLYCR